jgi:hypothetical protein
MLKQEIVYRKSNIKSELGVYKDLGYADVQDYELQEFVNLTEGYFLTKEEMKKLLEDGINFGLLNSEFGYMEEQEKQDYINKTIK